MDDISKRGDLAISAELARTAHGLKLDISVIPPVEEFWRITSGNSASPVAMVGRKWLSDPLAEPLEVYDLPERMRGVQPINGAAYFRLDRPGQDLITSDGLGTRTVNMSFLRLKGIAPGPVTFNMNCAISRDEMLWLGQQIHEATNIIYNQYIKPLVISIHHTLGEDVRNGLQ